MQFADHPVLRGLRALREPRGRALEVVEALCERNDPHPRRPNDWPPRLPSDADIAKRLRMSLSSVRTHLRTVSTWIEGLEELEPRTRIYLWYLHSRWEREL